MLIERRPLEAGGHVSLWKGSPDLISRWFKDFIMYLLLLQITSISSCHAVGCHLMYKFRYLSGYFILVNLIPLALRLYMSTCLSCWLVSRMNEILAPVLQKKSLYMKMGFIDSCLEGKVFITTLKWNLSHPYEEEWHVTVHSSFILLK